MEQKLNELHFSVGNFDKFYIHYLKRQNMLMETYFKKISKKNVDIVVFQDMEMNKHFSIRIIKKIYNIDGRVEYSPFITVFKYAEAEDAEKAIEDMFAFSSFLSVMCGGIFRIESFKALNSGTEIKLPYAPIESCCDDAERLRSGINNGNIDFEKTLKLWFENYKHRAYAQMVDIFINAAMRNNILRRDISDFAALTNALDTIARNKLIYLKKTDEYTVHLKEIIKDIENESYAQWLTNYADVRELRFDSKLDIVFDMLKGIFVFPNETSKNRFLQKVMDTRNFCTRLNGKFSPLEECNIPIVKRFLLYILRMCFLENLQIPENIIKKAFSDDKVYCDTFNSVYELIENKKY